MEVDLPAGTYVAAVSGGVDSMVLLDLLAKRAKSLKPKAGSQQGGLEIVVAHFDHGIRADSSLDARLVKAAAKKYGFNFQLGQGQLGARASEERARQVRYEFLTSVQKKIKAQGIITAHHQDDLIETAFINILRGTGPRGIVSLSSTKKIKRPLLAYSRQEIDDYAKRQKLNWREDSTNKDLNYLRNYLRRNIVSKLTNAQRAKLLEDIEKVAKNRQNQDQIIATFSQSIIKKNEVSRQPFSMLPVDVCYELVTFWLRENGCLGFDRKKISLISSFIRTGRPGSQLAVNKSLLVYISLDKARLTAKK